MKLVLIGIQGSGKSTQGNLLSKQLKIPYLSTGHIFREIAKEKTALGNYMKLTLNSGVLVPDDKTIEIVNNYLSRKEYKKGYILDGFPRTQIQAEKFKNHVDKVIYIKIPDKEATFRLVYRNNPTAREDETIPAIKKRIESFKKFTVPVVNYYKTMGLLVQIDGTKSIEEVNSGILKSLGKQVIKNHVQAWERKQKTIVALVGLPGSGKTDAASYFKAKEIPIITFGKIINDYITNHKLPQTEEHHKKVRMELREKHGREALAILNEDKISESLRKNMIIIIDGMRSWEEYLYLKKKLPKVRLVIIGLYADKDLRYLRVSERRSRRELYGEDRDINEMIGTNMGPTFMFADYLVKNNFSREEFHDKLEEVYRSVYFS